jgi:heptosyltransferase I
MNILIIKLSAIGDVVQTLPALEAIKKTYPDSSITWVVEEAAADILIGHPLINTLLISRRKTWLRMLNDPHAAIRGVAYLAKFFRDLRRIRYDIAIDFQGLLKSGVIIGFARAKRKIGFDRTREHAYRFLNERLPAYDKEKHALQRYLDVARYLGAVDPSPACTLPIEQERLKMKQRISTIRPSGRPLVVVNPIARWKTKLWPEKHFADLADNLKTEKSAVVVFTGSPQDRILNDRIISMMHSHAHNWAGETSLKELAALASLADVFITTDTGPMHLAAAAGAKVLALFGPTAPWRTGPYGEGHIIVRAGLACSPCFRRDCEDVKCMEDITVDDVMKQISL